MPTRTCDQCGKKKDLKWGVTCSTGHFICRDCKTLKGFIFDSKRTTCPICRKPLR